MCCQIMQCAAAVCIGMMLRLRCWRQRRCHSAQVNNSTASGMGLYECDVCVCVCCLGIGMPFRCCFHQFCSCLLFWVFVIAWVFFFSIAFLGALSTSMWTSTSTARRLFNVCVCVTKYQDRQFLIIVSAIVVVAVVRLA